MNLQRKILFQTMLAKEIAEKKRRLELAKNTNREYAEITMGSWSANGDRAVAERITDMQSFALFQTEKLLKELVSDPGQTTEIVKPPCYVKISTNGAVKEFYLVTSGAKVPNILIVTSDSPLGNAIAGKKLGEKFSYSLVGKIIQGVIIHLE